MAAGDVFVFDQFFVDVLSKLHDLSSDTIKIAFITDAVTPAVTDADPRWGAGGSTNYSTNEVTPGGNYSTGGETITNVSVTLSSGKGVFDGDNISIAVNGSNPTNARWGIIYNDTDAGKRAIAYFDIGSVFSLASDQFDIQWAASGIIDFDQA